MINFLQKNLAMGRKSAQGLAKGSIYNALYFISLMVPMSLVYHFLEDVLPQIETGQEVVFRYTAYIIITIVSLLVSGFFYYKQYTAVFVSTYEESEERRIRLAEKLRKLPLSFFSNKDLSDITNTMMEDINILEGLQSHAVPQMAGAVISTLVTAIGVIIWDWRIGLAVCWIMPVVLIVTLLSSRFQKKHLRVHFETKRRVSDQTQENIEHMADIHANNRTESYMKEYRALLKEEEDMHKVSEIAMSIFVNGGQSLLKLGFATTVIVGTMLFEQGSLSLLKFLMYLVVAARIYDPVGSVVYNLSYLYYGSAPLERTRELENSDEMTGQTDVQFDCFDIEFDHVSFEYLEDTPVLHNVSFTAKQGEITALIGPSGCGKSTAAKLAARFYDPTEGSVRIGGHDLKEIDPETIMTQLSMVFQDVILFDNTVYENIKLGRKNATEEEVMEAARLAHCDEFVCRLPDGYQTMIGENGARLSGGERQRISIARALLKNTPILLLDEATASLDVENESKIQAGLSALIRGKTVLMIAHRMRTIEEADHLVGLTDGRVVESGSPEDLIKDSHSLYRRLRTLQLGE
ncbi:MAG TPA: ABC transporter ATP-binding protein [Clostridiaceae bacterium]|jgi:ATP-binding cassette subfamily B protein IrtB|nr:ABC transporter ATP-binding protein [Clostridiaceae bacterium]